MSVLFVVVPLAMLVVLAAVLAFVWAAKRGQFDDLETPAYRALHDDEPSPPRPQKDQPAARGATRRAARQGRVRATGPS